MYHHYLQCGHALSDLLKLSEAEKLFYKASMDLEYENRREALSNWPRKA